MSERGRYVSDRMRAEQVCGMMKFVASMKLMEIENRTARKDLPYEQYLGTHSIINRANGLLRALGPVDHQAEKRIADEEWRCENLKRKRSLFDEGCGAPPAKKMRVEMKPVKKMRVEVPQLIGKRRREDDDLLTDAPSPKKRRVDNLVTPEVKQKPLALLSNGSEPLEHGLDNPDHESSELLKSIMILCFLVLVTVVLCLWDLLIGGSTSH